MPSPELQATIDSFDYRSYLKMKGLSDEEIPETLSSEAKQKIYSRAYSEYVKNEIKALQAETPGGMSPTAARKEIEERELEESPHLRPLWGYWEKELTAEDVYRPEMLFPVLKEKYGIDLSDPNFDIDKLGEKGKASLDDVINAYVPNIVDKKRIHRNVPELEGITKSEFAKQFRERNALLQGDSVESFLRQYKKRSASPRMKRSVPDSIIGAISASRLGFRDDRCSTVMSPVTLRALFRTPEFPSPISDGRALLLVRMKAILFSIELFLISPLGVRANMPMP